MALMPTKSSNPIVTGSILSFVLWLFIVLLIKALYRETGL
jgi:hypothetical protein